MKYLKVSILSALFFCLPCVMWAQARGDASGTIRGSVVLDENSAPLHNAEVYVLRTTRRAETDDDGSFQITGLPPGR